MIADTSDSVPLPTNTEKKLLLNAIQNHEDDVSFTACVKDQCFRLADASKPIISALLSAVPDLLRAGSYATRGNAIGTMVGTTKAALSAKSNIKTNKRLESLKTKYSQMVNQTISFVTMAQTLMGDRGYVWCSITALLDELKNLKSFVDNEIMKQSSVIDMMYASTIEKKLQMHINIIQLHLNKVQMEQSIITNLVMLYDRTASDSQKKSLLKQIKDVYETNCKSATVSSGQKRRRT